MRQLSQSLSGGAPKPRISGISGRRLPGAAVCLLAALCALTGLGGAARADKGGTDGTFRDRTGADHAWSVNRGHMLVWEGKPYTPAGVVFRSAFLHAPSPETFRQDQEELGRLQSAGVHDLWIDPQRGLLRAQVEQTQSLLDEVESHGFKYGLRVADRFESPLVGFSPTLPVVRVPNTQLQPGGRPSWRLAAPGARRAIYTLVDATAGDERVQNWAIASGEVVAEQDVAEVRIQLKNSKLLGRGRGLLLVVPEIQVEPEELGSFGDLWAGMDSYAERLQNYLKGLKFGPGFRFVLDPFAAGDGTVGREDNVFPSSPEFRAAFLDWLQHRVGLQTLNINWRLADTRIPGYEEAARMVPLWPRNDPPDGDGWMLDTQEMVAYRCNPRGSQIWSDLEAFRVEYLRRAMNRVTASLKQQAVNVPMLFSWGAYHPLFTNSPSPAGYDGLGGALYGKGAEIGRASAGYALAQAEESDRNSWLVATRLAGAPDDAGRLTAVADEAQARSLWSGIRDAGFRGFYFDSATVPDAVKLAKVLEPAVQAAQPAMERRPKVCFFPLALASSDRVALLSNGVWWLPSTRPAKLLRYGDSIMAYEMEQPLCDDPTIQKATVIWSTAGKQDVTFFGDKAVPVTIFDAAGAPVKMKSRAGDLRLQLTEEPLIIVGLDATTIFPTELATTQLREFEALIRQAESQKAETKSLRLFLEQEKHTLTPATAGAVYQAVLPYVNRLRDQLSPYVWLEGEQSAAHNFSGMGFEAGCSAGMFLKLDRADPPRSGVYRARYRLVIQRGATYDLWVGGRVPGRPGVSPMIWQIDDEPAVEVKSATAVGDDYGRGLAWFNMGRTALKAGPHELTLVIGQKAEGAGGRFNAAIDAVVLSREPFKPQGSGKPVIKLEPLVEENPEKPAKPSKRSERDTEKKSEREAGKQSDPKSEPKAEKSK